MEKINSKIKQKLESYQELYDSNQKLIYIGQKIDDLAGKYFNNKNKKDLVADFLKIIEVENSKRIKIAPKQAKIIIEKKAAIEIEVKKVVEEIRIEKKEKKLKPIIEKPKVILKIGDRVRMQDGKSIGTIDKIQKNIAIVNYGFFTSKVSLEQLDFVQDK